VVNIPTFLKFDALKKLGVVKNYPTLKRLIETQDFPPGRWLGRNQHVWTEQEIEDWIRDRPKQRPPERTEPATTVGFATTTKPKFDPIAQSEPAICVQGGRRERSSQAVISGPDVAEPQ
jgi:predicted DNA-binding transcriptional regulator AlpA